jgi:hypothetical protein
MSTETQPTQQNTGQSTGQGIVNSVIQIFDRVEKTSEKGAATILFIVGISLFLFTYLVKFFSVPMSKEMNSAEFEFSIVVAVVLILFGAATRLFLFYVAVSESKQVGKSLAEFEDRIEDRRAQSTKDTVDQRKGAQAGVG